MTERTGAILSVHASNFKVTGFTYSPEIAELVELGKKYDVPVLHDLGSGCLLETARFGLAHEATPQESVRAGVGMTFFSGDKLLGGPQAGIVVGTRDLVGAVSSHPLARAVRIDKLSMAALSATLLHYVKEEVEAEVPIWRMISMTDDELRVRADRWAESIGPPAEVARSASTVGGGSMPGETLPSWVLNLDTGSVDGGAEELAKRLRQGDTPVVGRIEEDRVLLDPRTVLPDDERAFLRAVRHATGRGGED
jgi:L-seryl-tRNA(Ser) seleniumtransferase